MIKRNLLLIAIVVTTTFFTSCFTRKVTRVNTNSVIDLSGRWNDTDSRVASKELAYEILTDSWVTDFMQEKKKKPVIIVGLVRNKSHEHINSETFYKRYRKSSYQK